jgi:hypothetical protein
VFAVAFSTTALSDAEYVGSVVGAVKVSTPPNEPSFVHAAPEIFPAEAVREISGVGTAALALGMKK